METITQKQTQNTDWTQLAQKLSGQFAETAVQSDQKDQFVSNNYNLLKEHDFFSAMIPTQLGGKGMSHSSMCEVLKILAKGCSSTALALSMHQHLIAANVWKFLHQKGGEKMLQKVAQKQLVLVSTGARDWLESNGEMQKVEGGYRYSAMKHFASQAPAGDIMITSGPFQDPEQGWQVLHFPVSLQAEGVMIMDNWYAMGMRGTGSHTIKLDKVFIPEDAVVLRRPQGEYHLFWNVVLTVALPLIMSVYMGIAEKAYEIAIAQVKSATKHKSTQKIILGELYNSLVTARIILKDMIDITNNFDFNPTDDNGNAMLSRKTLVAKACIDTVNKAMELVGGQSYFRKMELEKLFRDVQAGNFHPLPEKTQQEFTGSFLLKGSFN